MAFGSRASSKHNSIVGSRDGKSIKIPHPASTHFYDGTETQPSLENFYSPAQNDKMFETPAAKRRRVDENRANTGFRQQIQTKNETPFTGHKSSPQPRKKVKDQIPDSDDDNEDNGNEPEHVVATRTQLEEALPPVQNDQEAIDAYETQRAAEEAERLQARLATAGEDTLESRMSNRSWTRGKSSIYVDAFHLALSTVLQEEAHLFDAAEKQVFKYFTELSYEGQFLYVRLFLRKTSAWFRVGKLAYYNDIADVASAVQELQIERALPEGDPSSEWFPGEPKVPEEAAPLGTSFAFAESSDDQITTLNEASSLLLLDELKVLAKDAKVKGKNKSELLQNLRRTSGKQRGLGYLKRSETEGSATSGRSTPAPETEDEGDEDGVESENDQTPDRCTTPSNDHNRDAHYTRKILEQTGKCVRLSLTPLKLFERVHLVFYRSTEWTEKSLTTIILAKIARRNFPEYIVSRSVNIFESRAMLLEFESCLRLQFKVDSILEFSGYATRRDLEEVRAIFEKVYPRGQALMKKEQHKEDKIYETGEGPYLRRFSPAWVYTRIMHKVLGILAKFKEHLREHSLICELLDQRLFHPSRRGVWYQRKALLEEHYMYALTNSEGRSEEMNKKYWKRVSLRTCETGLQDRECHIRYHYDLQKRIKKLEKQLKIPKREQHDFGHVGLHKPFERTVYGTQIIREDRTPLRRKSSNPDSGTTPPALTRETSLQTNLNASTTPPAPNPIPMPTLAQPTPTSTSRTPPPQSQDPTRRGAKTIWLDTLDTSLPVSVESLSLSHYRKILGYKGYHTEGGILRTLFGLLFHTILFAYVPNVFQTPYQSCPLDLHTDAFYSTRISEINTLINELCNGGAERILREVWDAHAERKTCIVGVRWDYAFEDLVEIVRCWDGQALGTVMRVLAQEYAERGGGVPDLFLWKVYEYADADEEKGPELKGDLGGRETDTTTTDAISSTDRRARADPRQNDDANAIHQTSLTSNTAPRPYGKVTFVEVKSENDRLSDSQRLWISVLVNAGVEVELCLVRAEEVRRE